MNEMISPAKPNNNADRAVALFCTLEVTVYVITNIHRNIAPIASIVGVLRPNDNMASNSKANKMIVFMILFCLLLVST
jgi:hypothetical protein